jgi:predicted phage tail protein
MMIEEQIEISGAKSKSGSSVDDSIATRSVARFVELLSEGPIVGLVNGAKSIYFGKTPLQNEDDSYNFENVIWKERRGFAEDEPINGNSSVEQITSVETQVFYTDPDHAVSRTIVQEDADAVRVIVRLNALFMVKKGKVKPYSVSYAVDVRPTGGTWQRAVLNEIQKKKTSSPVQMAHRIVLPASSSGSWDVRVVRLTIDDEDDKHQSDLFFESFVTLVEGKFTYPHSALIATEVNAEDMGSQLQQRSYHIKGRTIKVPENLNTTTGQYEGVWNGDFKIAYSNSPAWILYDLIDNDRYGIGEFIDSSQADKWRLYVIAKHCAQLVPSGFKNSAGVDIMEQRYTFNGRISDRQEAFYALQQITTAFRGMGYWALGQFFATADMPEDPSQLVTPANVIGGEFRYSSTSIKSRHTVAIVKWTDPDDFYQPATELVIDEEMLAKNGWREKRLDLPGCTSRGLAKRYGRWVLDVENHETETVEYSASFDHISVMPGNIVSIADPRKANVRMGGRVISHVGNVITLDADVTLAPGQTYQIMLTKADGSIETVNVISRIGEAQLMLAAADQNAANGSVFIVTGTDVRPKNYRVLSVAETAENVFTVTALFHDPQKYGRVERGWVFNPINYGRERKVAKPKNLNVVEQSYLVGGSLKTRASLSWSAPDGVVVKNYIVSMESPDSEMTPIGSPTSNSMDINNLEDGDHVFHVKTVDRFNAVSQPAVFALTVQGASALASISVKNLKNLDRPALLTFDGNSPAITWDNSFPVTTDPADDEETVSPLYKHNLVKVYDNVTNTLLRTAKVIGNSYRYNVQFNEADSLDNGFGSPRRVLKFQVLLVDINGNISPPQEIVLTNSSPAVATVTAHPDGRRINISWARPTARDYAGTLVWVGAPGFDPVTTAPFIDSTGGSCTYVGENVTTYGVRIAHYDTFGKDSLNISPQVLVTTEAADVDFEPPTSPTGLDATTALAANGLSKIHLTWGASSGSVSYELGITEDGGNEISIPVGTNSYSFNAVRGSSYSIRVRGISYVGVKSTFSAPVTITAASDSIPPAVPASLTAEGTFGAIWLSWLPNTENDFDHYEIYESASSTNPGLGATATFNVSGTSLARDGLPAEATTRYYWIRGVDTSGNKSAWSARQQATTLVVGDILTTEDLMNLVDYSSFAAGFEPIHRVTSLPNPVGYTGPRIVLLTTNGKIYRYTGTAWTTEVRAEDIDARGLNILDIYGEEVFGSDGHIGEGAYISVDGNNIQLSEVALNSLVPSINFVGTFATAPTEATLGPNWRQNAVYKNSTDETTYVLTGTPLAWVVYLESGRNFYISIESTNGNIFRVGQSTTTTLKARLFKNGAEVTSVTPDSWFRWRRVSVIPQSAPNDDTTWNGLYASGYKQIDISVDTVYSQATFFCDIISS